MAKICFNLQHPDDLPNEQKTITVRKLSKPQAQSLAIIIHEADLAGQVSPEGSTCSLHHKSREHLPAAMRDALEKEENDTSHVETVLPIVAGTETDEIDSILKDKPKKGKKKESERAKDRRLDEATR